MIPVATTTISVDRPADQSAADPWETPQGATSRIADGVRAVISVNTGREVGPGDSETVIFTLLCDPTDLNYLDEVVDDVTGQRYLVAWVVHSPGIGGILSSTRAGLSTRKGL